MCFTDNLKIAKLYKYYAILNKLRNKTPLVYTHKTNGGYSMNIQEYEKFCLESGCGNFMQSVKWADIKNNWLHEFIAVRNNADEIAGEMLVLIKKIPFTNTTLMYSPRGPICDMHDIDILKKLFSEVQELQKKYHSFKLIIDPMIDDDDTQSINNLSSLGFIHHNEKVGYDNIQCRENYIIDINGRTADEVFSSFKSKWRYNIRLAQRKGVKCQFYGEEKIDDFYELMKVTGKRDGFDIRTKEYYSRFLKCFDGKAKLCMCYLDDIAISGALITNYAGTVSYIYGASSNDHRNYMPNYLMQWTMIKYAVESGCKTYDFCGIPYWYDETHKNYGVYKFKQGFNGHVQTWAGEFEYIFRKTTSKCFDFAMYMHKVI